MRSSLYACNCGFHWTRATLKKLSVNDASIRVACIIYGKLDYANNDRFRPTEPLDIALSALDLDTLTRVIWTFGIKSSSSHTIQTGVSRVVLRSEAAGSYCQRGYARLQELFEQGGDTSLSIKQVVHLPSLYLLAKEASTHLDIRFIESLFQKIDLGNSSKRRILNQLSLF